MAGLTRPKFCLTLQRWLSSKRQWNPPLRQAASSISAYQPSWYPHINTLGMRISMHLISAYHLFSCILKKLTVFCTFHRVNFRNWKFIKFTRWIYGACRIRPTGQSAFKSWLQLSTTSSLPQAGAQLVPVAVRNSSFCSRPSLCDTPACGKLLPSVWLEQSSLNFGALLQMRAGLSEE